MGDRLAESEPTDRRERQADAREAAADRREQDDDIREGVLDGWERELVARAIELDMFDELDAAAIRAARQDRVDTLVERYLSEPFEAHAAEQTAQDSTPSEVYFWTVPRKKRLDVTAGAGSPFLLVKTQSGRPQVTFRTWNVGKVIPLHGASFSLNSGMAKDQNISSSAFAVVNKVPYGKPQAPADAAGLADQSDDHGSGR